MASTHQRLGEYVLTDPLGQGAFGEVWRAHHHAWVDQVVAIKIPTDGKYVHNLQKEGAAIYRLSHPNIVRPIAFDPYAPEPYLVMEYVPGCSLRKLVTRGPLRIEAAVQIMHQVLLALHYAHEQGLVHRDIKPENILLHKRALRGPDVRPGTVKLTDFGLGHSLVQSLQSVVFSQDRLDDRQIAGTHLYIAPEQLEGAEVDARTDLYACGIVLFEMLTGKRPIGTEVPSDLNPAVPPELDAVFRRAVARRERRIATATEFRAALDEALRSRQPAHAPHKNRSDRLYLVAGVAVAVVIFIAMIWRFFDRPRSTVPLAHVPRMMPLTTQPAPPFLPPTQSFVPPPLARRDVPPAVVKPLSPSPLPDPVIPAAGPSPPPKMEDGIAVANSTDAREATDVVHDLSTRYPDIMKPYRRLELVKYHNGDEFNRNAGGVRAIDGAFSAHPVAGSCGFIWLWGIYEDWPAGRYLIAYRLQSKASLTGENVCFVDVCRGGNTIAERRPSAAELEEGKWRVVPVVLEINGPTQIEYRLWAHDHLLAMDRVYVFRDTSKE